MKCSYKLVLFFAALLGISAAAGQDGTVRGTVDMVQESAKEHNSSEVVIWLTPLHAGEPVGPGPKARLLQKNKRFTPHVLVVTQGTQIDFPNEDPFFHNVFSIYRGKPFDLGLYESGGVRTIRFSKPGASYIFCNIHPEMSAVIVVLQTRYFAVTAQNGNFQIAHVPPGRYKLEVFYERATEAELAAMAHEVEVKTGDNQLPTLTVHSIVLPKQHLNKYGEPYKDEKKDKY